MVSFESELSSLLRPAELVEDEKLPDVSGRLRLSYCPHHGYYT